LLHASLAALAVYAGAWALFSTHEEMGVSTRAAFPLAVWTFPIVCLISLVSQLAREAGARRR
jgi:hypothetical protein